MPEAWEDTDANVDRDVIRARLRKLSDVQLIREGQALRSLVSPAGRNGNPPRPVFLAQLEECLGEWRGRHRR